MHKNIQGLTKLHGGGKQVDIISRFWSDNGKREAVVSLYCSEGPGHTATYLLETRERGMLKGTKPFDYLDKAEDEAENWVQNK